MKLNIRKWRSMSANERVEMLQQHITKTINEVACDNKAVVK